MRAGQMAKSPAPPSSWWATSELGAVRFPTAPVKTPPPAGTSSTKSDTATTAIVTTSLILSAIVFAAVGWAVDRSLSRAFKKQ